MITHHSLLSSCAEILFYKAYTGGIKDTTIMAKTTREKFLFTVGMFPKK